MRARKRFGQHFLDSEQVIADIVSAVSPRRDDHIVEIGPGRGALTTALYGTSRWLTLIEIDRDLIPRLCSRFPEARVHTADILEFPLETLAPLPVRVLGNLPYNISTPLLLKLLQEERCITDMHFMLQREVAERISAGPGTKAWGRLSVLMQYHCEVELLFDVAPESFVPPPEVWSSVVRLRPRRETKPAVHMESLDRVLRAVFAQRRKQLGNALRSLATAEQWRDAGLDIDFRMRAESITLAQFIGMANALSTLQEDAP